MCLTTSNPEVKVAQEDIEVYKSIVFSRNGFFGRLFNRRRGRSGLTGHLYRRGEIQMNVRLYARPIRSGSYRVDEGYHSDVKRIYSSNALFVIPKGTKYIEGWYNDTTDRKNYVSETIIFKKRLKQK